MSIRLNDEEQISRNDDISSTLPTSANYVRYNHINKHQLSYIVAKIEERCSAVRIHNIPLINIGIISVLVYLLCRLSTKYHKLYTRSSLLATIATNLVLFGIADTMAQSISAFFSDSRRIHLDDTIKRGDTDEYNYEDDNQSSRSRTSSVSSSGYALEINRYVRSMNLSDSTEHYFVDYGDVSPDMSPTPVDVELGEGGNPARQIQVKRVEFSPTRFIFRRFFAFMLWGFIQAFIQVAWYSFLNSMYTDDPTIVGVLERDLTDQLCFSPVSLICFFTYGTIVIESGTMQDVRSKLFRIYLSTLACNFCLWFPVQFINFLVMPRRFQVPFSSAVGVLWNCFLSFRNASAK